MYSIFFLCYSETELFLPPFLIQHRLLSYPGCNAAFLCSDVLAAFSALLPVTQVFFFPVSSHDILQYFGLAPVIPSQGRAGCLGLVGKDHFWIIPHLPRCPAHGLHHRRQPPETFNTQIHKSRLPPPCAWSQEAQEDWMFWFAPLDMDEYLRAEGRLWVL